MPYIEVIEPHDADDALRQAYAKVAGDRGRAANILKIHSLLPETMTGHLDFYMKIMFAKGALNRQERELVATVVSAANDCDYCVNHHAEALFAYVKDRDIVNQIGKDYTQVELSQKERAMCDHAVKLTQHPEQVGEADIEALRQAGLTDKDVLHLTMVIGYFNFVNRMALGLGVPFSEEEIKGYKY